MRNNLFEKELHFFTIIAVFVFLGITSIAIPFFLKDKQIIKSKAAVTYQGACVDYPPDLDTPVGYRWKALCGDGANLICHSNEDCASQNRGQWCYGFQGKGDPGTWTSDDWRCMKLETPNSGTSNITPTNIPTPTPMPSPTTVAQINNETGSVLPTSILPTSTIVPTSTNIVRPEYRIEGRIINKNQNQNTDFSGFEVYLQFNTVDIQTVVLGDSLVNRNNRFNIWQRVENPEKLTANTSCYLQIYDKQGVLVERTDENIPCIQNQLSSYDIEINYRQCEESQTSCTDDKRAYDYCENGQTKRYTCADNEECMREGNISFCAEKQNYCTPYGKQECLDADYKSADYRECSSNNEWQQWSCSDNKACTKLNDSQISCVKSKDKELSIIINKDHMGLLWLVAKNNKIAKLAFKLGKAQSDFTQNPYIVINFNDFKSGKLQVKTDVYDASFNYQDYENYFKVLIPIDEDQFNEALKSINNNGFIGYYMYYIFGETDDSLKMIGPTSGLVQYNLKENKLVIILR